MSMDSARWRTRDIDLMKFFLDATAVAGWQFKPSEQNGRESKIGLVLNGDRVLTSHVELAPRAGRVMEQNGFQKERDVAESGFCSAIDRQAFRPFELAINERNVDLKSKTVGNRVASNDLRDRTVFVLAGRISHFAPIDLHRPEMSELLAHRGVPSRQGGKQTSARFHSRHGFQLWCVATAEITCPTR